MTTLKVGIASSQKIKARKVTSGADGESKCDVNTPNIGVGQAPDHTHFARIRS
jgi:hypothetical protein